MLSCAGNLNHNETLYYEFAEDCVPVWHALYACRQVLQYYST